MQERFGEDLSQAIWITKEFDKGLYMPDFYVNKNNLGKVKNLKNPHIHAYTEQALS